MLVREVLYVLQGIEGGHIKFDSRQECYKVDPHVGGNCSISKQCCIVVLRVVKFSIDVPDRYMPKVDFLSEGNLSMCCQSIV